MARYEAEQSIHLSVIKRQRAEKNRLMSQIRNKRHIDQMSAQIVRAYWNQVSKILHGLEQVGTAKEFATDVHKDIQSLKMLRANLENRTPTPETKEELTIVRSLLEILGVVLAAAKKRAKELSDARFAWLFSVNPAKPKKNPWWKRKEKDKEKRSKSPLLRELKSTFGIKDAQGPETKNKKEDPTKKRERD